MNVGAVVLAAGGSLRMGSPKALLKIGEETFVQRVVGQLTSAGISDVAVVLGADADEVRCSLQWFNGTVVINREWEKGQLSSIIIGLDALVDRQLEGVLICPVDRPLITHELISVMLKAFGESAESIVVPVYQGRRGHPAIFPSAMFDELRAAPSDVGARHVIWNHPSAVLEVATDEIGAVVNIDSPADYQSHILPHFTRRNL